MARSSNTCPDAALVRWIVLWLMARKSADTAWRGIRSCPPWRLEVWDTGCELPVASDALESSGISPTHDLATRAGGLGCMTQSAGFFQSPKRERGVLAGRPRTIETRSLALGARIKRMARAKSPTASMIRKPPKVSCTLRIIWICVPY